MKKKAIKGTAAGRFLLAALLALSLLSGCSAREGAALSSSEAIEPPQASSLASSAPEEEASSSSSSESENGQLTQEQKVFLQPGRIFALGDPQAPALPERAPTLATAQELSRWQELLSSGETARLDAMGMGERERELSAESAGEVLRLLQTAELSLYQAAGNPPTGGAVNVYAYNQDGAQVFAASFNGEGLSVQFAQEDGWYLFNGEGSGLQRLQEFIE